MLMYVRIIGVFYCLFFEFSLHFSRSASTKKMPNLVVFGLKPIFPLEVTAHDVIDSRVQAAVDCITSI